MKSKAGFSKKQWKEIADALGSWAWDCEDNHELNPELYPTKSYATRLSDRAWKIAHSLEDPQR
jgi:hypothetical protein